MEPILSAKNLKHRRGDFVLEVARRDFLPGRIYCLVGPNGAGKSTLLHLLALLSPPDRGEILLAGEAVRGETRRRQLRQQITLVEQSPFLFDTTVYHNLVFGLRLRNVRGELQRRRISRALQAVGLTGFEDRRARELSGGETRRVALARAMVLRPRVLLLDEPSEGLDRQALPLFEECLTDLSVEGTTVLVATHDADQPRRLRGEVLYLEAGRLVTADTSPRASNTP